MKITTTTFVLAIGLSLYAQKNNYSPIPILQDAAIQWSAESDKVINLSPKTPGNSLKKWYLDKIKKEGVRAYIMKNNREFVSALQLSIPLLGTQDWLKGLSIEWSPNKNVKEWYFVDESMPKDDYKRYKYRTSNVNFSPDSCCGCDEADAFRTKQVVNYKNGKFSIYNIFISPLCARQPSYANASEGKTGTTPIGWYPLCNVAYNDKADRKFPGLNKDVVFLNTDVMEYEFSREHPSPFDSVLTVYSTDIGSLLYLDILKGNIKPVDIETGKPMPVKKFLTSHMPADTIPVYNDNMDGISAYKVLKQERSSTGFSHLRITQDFYFDFKNERLYSVIRSVIVILPVKFYDGSISGYMPYCRLEQ